MTANHTIRTQNKDTWQNNCVKADQRIQHSRSKHGSMGWTCHPAICIYTATFSYKYNTLTCLKINYVKKHINVSTNFQPKQSSVTTADKFFRP